MTGTGRPSQQGRAAGRNLEQPSIDRDDRDRERLSVVESYLDRVLDVGRDRWSGEDTPLLADGVHVDTLEPVTWCYDDTEWIVHNLASQQNLFRALTGATNLTGDERYEAAARDAIAYHFEHLVDESGLLRWGGHQFVDLESLEPVGRFDTDAHEFKFHFPYYELMWAVDSEATAQFVQALWSAHVLDPATLDMNRHGQYGTAVDDPWAHEFDDPEPFFEGEGLSFVNIGSDLIYAAGTLHALADEPRAWEWGRRLAKMYVKARHPETGLGAYQYTKTRRDEEPPEGPLTGELTYSTYGDRAENQFRAQFGDVAREGWVVWGSRIKSIYVTNAFVQLGVAELLEDGDSDLTRWTVDGLSALAEHAYLPEENAFRPMWADGSDLTGETYDRTGYYGEEGTAWEALPADVEFLLSYARGYRLSGRDTLWETARQIADGLGLGDVGQLPGEDVDLDLSAPGDSPEEVFAMLELYRAAPNRAYLDRARSVADRMTEERYHHGFFLPSENHVHARFDAIEPLAILALDATLRGEPGMVPAYLGGSGYIHGTYDGHGRTRDDDVIWGITREA